MRGLLHPAPRPAPTWCRKLTRDAIREEQSSPRVGPPTAQRGAALSGDVLLISQPVKRGGGLGFDNAGISGASRDHARLSTRLCVWRLQM
jgi:hypothetical protein